MVFEYWIIFSVIGLVIPVIGKLFFHATVTWKEFLAIVAINSSILAVVIGAGSYHALTDTEIHNGVVTHKHIDKVPCQHSYSCNCRTVSCGKGCTTTHCDTCYEHSHDWDHVVETTVGQIIIDRVDRQGKSVPPRWKSVEIGEPASLSHSFTNYIKASPDSLFNLSYLNDESVQVPEYPKVFDYYRVNRVLNVSEASIDTQTINRELNLHLRTLGAEKQVNLILVFWNHENDKWVDVLKAKWLNGKQNDLIVAIKTKPDSTIEAVESFGFSKDSSVYYKINREVKSLESATKTDELVNIIVNATKTTFVRQSMEDFKYLEDLIEPPLWVMIFASLLSIFGTMLATWFAHKHDWFYSFHSHKYTKRGFR